MTGANVIMTQTLPSIVGMGVVSRATETTLGKKGRRAKARKGKTIKVYRGRRGGTYVIRKGRKIYL